MLLLRTVSNDFNLFRTPLIFQRKMHKRNTLNVSCIVQYIQYFAILKQGGIPILELFRQAPNLTVIVQFKKCPIFFSLQGVPGFDLTMDEVYHETSMFKITQAVELPCINQTLAGCLTPDSSGRVITTSRWPYHCKGIIDQSNKVLGVTVTVQDGATNCVT